MNKPYPSFRSENCCFLVCILVILMVSINVFAGSLNERREATGALKDTVALARGDFNGDNLPDLVQITVDFKISVLKGYGNGSFELCSTAPVSTTAGVRDVAVGDFNQDGKLDAVVSHFGGASQFNQVSVFSGNGTCGLVNETLYNLNQRADATAVEVGDFTGDGWPDIAVTSYTEPPYGQFWLMKNNGAGAFPNGSGYSFLGFPGDIKAGHLNTGHALDVAIASNGGVTIFYGLGDGTFAQPETVLNSLTTTRLTLGDFNLDGRTDIAATGIDTNSWVRVFLNTALGFPNSYQQFAVSHTVRSITSADLNNDGKLDVATTNGNYSSLNEVNVLYGNGNGTLQSYLIEKGGTEPLEIIAGDLNGDSKTDLAVGNCCGGNQGLGVFLNSPNQARYFTDFDGDRKSDVSIVRPDAQAVWWVLKSSDSSYYAVSFGYGTDKIVPANYDGKDAKADIAVYRNGTWYILNSSNGTVRTEYFGVSTDKPTPADYDNDGAADIAIYRPSIGQWCIKLSLSGQVTYTNFGSSADDPVAADYDGDGKADIGVYRPSDYQWYLLRSRDGFLQVSSPGGAGDKPVQGDYDTDGKVDVAAVNGNTWRVLQSSNSTVVAYSVGAYQRLVPGEYTGDSKSDVGIFNAGLWTIRKSEDGNNYTVNWGLTGDVPIPSAYVP